MTVTAIDEMHIRDIDFSYGQGSYFVTDADLKWEYPSEYQEDFSGDEFFSLALRYIEETVADVESVDYAKMDFYTRHTG